jgi:small-conductance mechanosensitive channel/CRP-like cAMP-binding protein
MNLGQRIIALTTASPFTGAGMSLCTALLALAILLSLRRMLPPENRDHGQVLKIFLAVGAVLAATRLGLLALDVGQPGLGRILTMLSTFLVAMGVIGTAVMGVFEILPRRANIRFPLLLRDLVLVLGFVVVLFGVLGQSGVDVASLVATSAVLTAILGLALQSTLTNILAGILLHVDRSLGVGDWVQFGQRQGCIMEIRWRSTVLRTTDGDTVIIPNAQITAQEIHNFSRPLPLHRARVSLGFHYRHPPNEVRRLLVEAARATPEVLAEPAPDCFPVEFGESAVVYTLRYWIDRFERDGEIRGEVLTRVWYAASRAGLEIPYPTRTLVEARGAVDAPAAISGGALRERVAALEQVDLFSTLEPAERQVLADGLHEKRFALGEAIVTQGQDGDSMFIIAEGRVQVSLAQDSVWSNLASLSAGDVLGEMSLMTGEPRTATCLAATDVLCYELDRATLQQVLTTRPAIADQMSALLAGRQEQIERKGGELQARAAARTTDSRRDLVEKIRRLFNLK